MKIPDFKFEQITDSRGVPTLNVVVNHEGVEIESKVPAGTSTGTHEAVALSMPEVLKQEDELKKWLVGSEFADLREFDQALINKDGTDNKSQLGGNTILGLSMMYARVSAELAGQHLADWLQQELAKIVPKLPQITPDKHFPTPMMVMIEGGKHAQNGPFIQEMLINCSMPDGTKIWHQLDTGDPMGMEGGFDMSFPYKDEADRDGLNRVKDAITTTATAATISIDVAANNVPEEYRYSVSSYIGMAKDFSLQSIEDPFVEDDWDNWARLCLEVKGHRLDTKIIGDDLTVTNRARLQEAIDRNAVTGVIVKPNQVGSVSETLNFASLAKEKNLMIIVSHRSGETDDTFIADLAVAVGADSLKAGAPSKTERLVKYERLNDLING